MADSYLGFLNTTQPTQVGDLLPPPAAEAPFPTQVLTQSGNNITMAPGTTTPSSVNVESMPVIVSLVNRTTDIEYASNTTTITGDLEVDEDIVATGDITGTDIYATNNIAATDLNLTRNIIINPHNTAPFNNTTVLNTNIQIGQSDNGTVNLFDAPSVAIYPSVFSVGGIIYMPRLCELTGLAITLTTPVLPLPIGSITFISPLLTAGIALTNWTGAFNLAGALTVVGAISGTTVGGGTVNALTSVNAPAGAFGTVVAATSVASPTISAGLALSTPGALTVTGPAGSVNFGTLAPPLPILSFTVVSTGPASITSVAGVLLTGLDVVLTAGIPGVGPTLSVLPGGVRIDNGSLTVTDISGVVTINGAAYPPPGGSPSTWSQFPATQNVTIPTPYSLLTNNIQGNGNPATSIVNVNSQLSMANNTLLTTGKISSLDAPGFVLEANNLVITGFNNAPATVTFNNANLTGVSQINGAAYPPPADTPSQWATYNAVQNVTIPNPFGLNTNRIGPATPGGTITMSGGLNVNSNPITGVTTINGQAYPPPAGNASTWSQFPATQTVNMASQTLNNAARIATTGNGNNMAIVSDANLSISNPNGTGTIALFSPTSVGITSPSTSLNGTSPVSITCGLNMSNTAITNPTSITSTAPLNITGVPLTLTNVTSINGNPYPINTLIGFTPIWEVGEPLTGTRGIPVGAISMDMIMIGGGGGGGGSASFINNGAGGGAAGYIRMASAISIGDYVSLVYSIGAGGVGGTPGNPGGGGGNTSLLFVATDTRPTVTWLTGGGGAGGGATGGVNDGGGPGGTGGAGGGGGWVRTNTAGIAGGGSGQWNGTQSDNGGAGGQTTSNITAGTGGANQFGSLATFWPGPIGSFAATGGVGGGYGGGYQIGFSTPTCGIPIAGYGGGGGGQNSDGSGGQGDGSGGATGAVGNIWIRWYFQ